MALNVAAVQKYAMPYIKNQMVRENKTDTLPYFDNWDLGVDISDLPYCCTTVEMSQTTDYVKVAMTICYALQNRYFVIQCNSTSARVRRVLKFFGFEEKYKYFGGHGAYVHCMVLILRGYKL